MTQAQCKEPPIAVIFRADKSDGEIVAVFPTEPDGHVGMVCYAHMGQHSGCSFDWVRNHTRPASADEAADLRRELESAPYHYSFKIRHRITRQMRDEWRRNNRRG